MSAHARLRHVVIGVGAGVFKLHRPMLQQDHVELVGVSDVNADLGRQRANELGCPVYADHRAMLAETHPEVAVVLTPHPLHAPIAIDCLEAGCHVLVEKPIAVQVSEADAMIEAAAQLGRLLAVNLQHRFRPEVRAAYQLIQRGFLGQIQRVELVSVWTRTASYYRLGSWRGTWAGEGGGVLMNQAPHHLDLLCHLAGQPKRVVAWTRTLLHEIETEDTAVAMMEWPGGALGVLHASTAEVGEPERLEIAGTRGILRIDHGDVTFQEAETDLRAFVAECPEPFAALILRPAPVERGPGTGDHEAVYRNFHQAIYEGTPLMADGAEARMSLELANAMIYSSFAHREVELPLDRGAYAALLDDLKASRVLASQTGLRESSVAMVGGGDGSA